MKWPSLLVMIVVSMVFFNFSCVSAETVAPIEILSITHTNESADAESISFVLSAPVEPKSFQLKGDKPRLVLDFANCFYNGAKAVTLDSGVLASAIRSGIHQQPAQKTRIVVDLSKDFPVTYSQFLNEDGKVFIVNLGRGENSPAVKQDDITKPSQAELEAIPLDKKPIPPVFSRKEQIVVAPEKSKVVKGKDEIPVVAEEQILKPEVEKQLPPDSGAESAEVAAGPIESIIDKQGDPDPQKPAVEAIQEQAEKVGKITSAGPELLGLSFDDSSNRGEMVLFHLNDFFPPTVSAIEKENPRVLCDFLDMRLGQDVETSIFANGKYVERIRAAKHDNPAKVRVVLDLAPDRDYDLQQVFFKNDNLFVLIVNELPAEKEAKK